MKQDWILNGALLFLALCSLLILSSIDQDLFIQQFISYILAIGIVWLFSAIDWRSLANYRWLVFGFFLFTVVLLIVTAVVAPSIRGTRSWIVVGPVQFQTSELAKVSLIILLAYFFARRHIGIARLGVILKSFIYFAIPGFLVLRQPDLGSAISIFCIWLGFLLVSGIRWKHLLVGLLILALLFGLAWNFFLKPYQKERVFAFVNPNYDTLGFNYNVIQSKIAIGSAGFFGKGYGQGTQVQLGFLPAAATDFVFSAFTEEWGFFGATLVIVAFTLMLMRIIQIGAAAHDNFSKLVCLGTAIIFLSHFIINMGSAMGLLPVVGITFPFLSYGGSSLLTSAMLIGIIQSVVVRSSFIRTR